MMQEEKRKAPRVKTTLVSKYSRVSNGEDQLKWDQTELIDISAKGVCLTTKDVFLPGEKIRLQIKTPLDPFHWIEATGEIVESRQLKSVYPKINTHTYLNRIKFIELKPEFENAIVEYVNWILKKERAEK
jgi:hypothetical protein